MSVRPTATSGSTGSVGPHFGIVAVLAVWAAACGDGVTEPATTITAATGKAGASAEITVGTPPIPEEAALVALYEATDGPNWQNNDGWLTDAPLGDWYGVEKDVAGRVVRLDLGANNLSGSIPPELGTYRPV